ncbi:MAG: hypothetical protein HQ591_01480 [candidate division Zixibacteria bacterium]|nr:hypothetical protein [Candidatus Tariuqbacter arcticus]
MKGTKLFIPFKNSESYWYLFPRAFWPYKKGLDGIKGFHRFLELTKEHQEHERIWNHDSELEVLIMLEEEGITPIWEEQEDYHAHYRNRINFAKKLGFIHPDKNNPIEFTEVGKQFLRSKEKDWQEIFEHQLIRYQFTNPNLTSRYDDYLLFPFMFTLSVILETGYISIEEFILRVFISKSHKEKEDVLSWIKEWRKFSENSSYKPDLNTQYSARMIMISFALSPALDFIDNKLLIKDKDRARFIFAKCWPNIQLCKFKDKQEWIEYYGNLDDKFWPLFLAKEKEYKNKHRKYISREEGEEHKSIKRFTIENANEIFGDGAVFYQEEYYFASADRANLVFSLPNGKYFTIEVEVNVGKNDIVGLLQAIKYKYMFAIQEGLNNEQVMGMLIAEKIHKNMKSKCAKYGIYYFERSTGENTFISSNT